MEHERLLILDYGSQYTQLITRRAREFKVFAEVRRPTISIEELRALQPRGIILSGGPASVLTLNAPGLPKGILDLGIPILGICYGMQLLAKDLGGKVRKSSRREYGLATLTVDDQGSLLRGMPTQSNVWASHGDDVEQLPIGFQSLGTTGEGILGAAEDLNRKIFVIQFHPEVAHTEHGTQILKNFLFSICKFSGDWKMDDILDERLADIKKTVGNKKVLCALSGGVDSSVVAALLHRAIPGQVRAVFVDHGLLRLGEAEQVHTSMNTIIGTDLVIVNAQEQFLQALENVQDPEKKRKIIGKQFIDVFEQTAKEIGGADILAQGTLYPDVIESGTSSETAVTIKSHHNVGGLPEHMGMELLEPVRDLFKDEVRALGRLLGLPSEIVDRHPFPGPGLAVRILGAITRPSLALLSHADAIFLEELRRSGEYSNVWQAFAVLLPVRTVGVMGDERTYENVIALRAVTSTDGMTADWAKLPSDILGHISSRIIQEVQGVNRVVYDISSKPPSTIEWE